MLAINRSLNCHCPESNVFRSSGRPGTDQDD